VLADARPNRFLDRRPPKDGVAPSRLKQAFPEPYTRESGNRPGLQKPPNRIVEKERPTRGGADTTPSNAKDASEKPAKTDRWTLGFIGIMFYALIEYSRLPEMYPVLQILYLGKVAVILAGIGYLVNPRARSGVRAASRGTDTAVLIFMTGILLSSCLTSYQTHVWGGFIAALYYGIVYFLLTRLLTSLWQIRTFLLLVLLLNLKLAQHTVRSYATDRSAGMSDMRIIMSGGAGQGASSFFGNVGDLGLAMAVVWGITWSWLVGKVEKKKLMRAFLIICFVAYFLAIVFSGSRGALVGAAAIVMVAVAKSSKRVAAGVLAVFFALSLWLIVPSASKVRFEAAWNNWHTDPDSASRITFWEIGLDIFAHNPILGVGPNNFVDVNPLHRAAHSMYIQVLSETGLVGTFSFLAMIFLFFRTNARTRKLALQTEEAGRRSFPFCLAFGLDLGMVGFLTSGTFLSVLYYPHLWILLGLSVALNKCCLNARRESVPVQEMRPRKLAPAVS
jgi:putative inorganic carbon (hco3(-)) transporter